MGKRKDASLPGFRGRSLSNKWRTVDNWLMAAEHVAKHGGTARKELQRKMRKTVVERELAWLRYILPRVTTEEMYEVREAMRRVEAATVRRIRREIAALPYLALGGKALLASALACVRVERRGRK